MIEKGILKRNLSFYQSFYMRYEGDISAIFNSLAGAQLFLIVLNNQHPNLCFTCEAPGPSLPILDVKVMICIGKFDISVYHKPTFTSVFIHFISIAPLS